MEGPSLNDIPKEFLEAMGKIVVRWNHMEWSLNMRLAHILGHDYRKDRSHVVFVHMAFPQKLDVMGALCEDPEVLTKFPKLKDYKTSCRPKLLNAQTARNSIVHSLWGTRQDGFFVPWFQHAKNSKSSTYL